MILLLILFLSTAQVWGQVKIGELTIPDTLAAQYFLDCYIHPDTVELHNLCPHDDYEQFVIHHGDRLLDGNGISRGMGHIVTSWTYSIARTPSSQDFGKWFARRKK